MTLRDRMNYHPIWKAMAPRIEAMIDAINAIGSIIGGQNPHKANDTADLITEDDAVDLETCIDLEQQLIDNYETHIASSTYHAAADSTNVVTELGIPKEIYTLLNELKVDYEANRVNVTSHHGGSGDTTNTITEDDATTKATAVALANDLKTNLLAHMALTAGSVHGAADTVNGVDLAAIDDLDENSTWTEIAEMADEIKTAYSDHIAYTTSSVHAGADSTNTVSAGSVGDVQTALTAGLTELKTDMNAHFAEFGTSHQIKDTSISIATATPSTLALSIELANEAKLDFNDHISRAGESAITAIDSLDLEE